MLLRLALFVSYASRVADCRCVDDQLRRSSCSHCKHYPWPRCVQLRELSAKGVAYDFDDVGHNFHSFHVQPVVPAASQRL